MRELLRNVIGYFLLALLLFFVLAMSSLAEVATYDEARQVCSNWLTYMTLQKGEWAGSSNPQIVDMREINMDGRLMGRCFVIAPSGYVVVPIIKELPPIKVCSETSELNPDDIDGFAYMLKQALDYSLRMYVEFYGSLDAVQPDKGEVLLGREHRRQWDRFLMEKEAFIADLTGSKEVMAEYGPLLSSQWDQGDPYNQLCPIGDGGRTVVGCVATAAVQLMNYYQWPLEGVGSHLYYWGGDYSCEGSSPGKLLGADFSDKYSWDDMPLNCYSGCDATQNAALAELSYEVGISFNMDYGVCGSGAYTHNCMTVMPSYFRYLNQIQQRSRQTHTLTMWSEIIRDEVIAGRPMLYGIFSHAIVADGWRDPSGTAQVHMNYGWADTHTAWYTIDNLHCPWEGCNPMNEEVYIYIEPDKRAWFTCDTSWGFVPFTVNFTGNSSMTPGSWAWNFGDTETSDVQSPTHIYNDYGQYDVSLVVNSAKETGTYTATNYIIALADTMKAGDARGEPGEQVIIEISVTNTVEVDRLIIPVQYSGDMELTLDSARNTGTLTEGFDQFTNPVFDPFNKRSVYTIYNTDTATAALAPGTGTVLKLYFTISAGATAEQSTSIEIYSFYGYDPMFYGPIVDFSPACVSGGVSGPFSCGDVNQDEAVNIFDVTYLISYLYKSGPPPEPMKSGDVNNDCTVNIFDITYLISFLYKDGPDPTCPAVWPCK